MKRTVLYARDSKTEWNTLLRALPGGDDIYFQAEYVQLHESASKRAALFVAEQDEDGFVLAYPFLLQKIPEELTGEIALYDLETAYGYGGPLISNATEARMKEASLLFDTWAEQEGVVAEFVRFHPVRKNQNHAMEGVQCLPDRMTCGMDLQLEDLMLSLHAKTRNMVRRARNACEIQVITDPDLFRPFERFYSDYMRHIGAVQDYLFDPAYFSELGQLLGSNAELLVASHEGEWVGAALFFYGQCTAHYHLSATKPSRTVPGVTNLLILEAAKRAKARNLSVLHLGGGRTTAADDSLLRFKQRMGSLEYEFVIGKKVHHPSAYATLVETWKNRYPAFAIDQPNRILCYRFTP